MADSSRQNSNSNGRVTNALLKQSMDHLLEEVRDLKEYVKNCNQDYETRLRELERWQTQSSTRWNMLGGGVLASLATSIGAAIKAIFG